MTDRLISEWQRERRAGWAERLFGEQPTEPGKGVQAGTGTLQEPTGPVDFGDVIRRAVQRR